MRRAGFTLTLGEMLGAADMVGSRLGPNTPIVVNDVPVDEAGYVDGRINLTQERTDVIPASAVISMITDVLGVSRSKKVEDILKNFGEEYGLI